MRHEATISVKGTYTGEEMGEEEEEEEERWGKKKEEEEERKKERKKETRNTISQTVQGTKETRRDKSK